MSPALSMLGDSLGIKKKKKKQEETRRDGRQLALN